MCPLTPDFTMTAVRRPELVRQTLESFNANLKGVQLRGCQLYLNVDPLPLDCGPAVGDEVRGIAEEYFGNVLYHSPASPSFPKAVKWCWRMPRSPYFFHLEDDWELREPFDVRDLAKLLDADSSLSNVGLRCYGFDDDRICLSPGLFRTAHAKEMSNRMRDDWNPEKQLRPVTYENKYGGCERGFRGVRVPAHAVIRDLGRPWMEANGCKKAPVYFTTWES